jgi:hypothetical protein
MFGDEDRSDDDERLRRYLRALSAVNWQLQAQLETGAVHSQAGIWLEQLQVSGGGDPFLVRSAERGMFLIEAGMRRSIKAGLLFGALTHAFALHGMTEAELDALDEGPPVEVLRGPSGPAFIVAGGRRFSLRGLPLPYAVSADEMARFPEARELRVGTASEPLPASSRARALVQREGPVRGSVLVLRGGMRRVKRAVSPKPH